MDRPTQATTVKGFHKYTRAAKSPEGRTSGNIEDASKKDEQEYTLNSKKIHSLTREF